MTITIPYARQWVDDQDAAAVEAALRGDLLTQGSNLDAFEAELAAVLGARHVVVCASGTAALHLAYLGMGLAPGSTLITSPVTFLATANAAAMCGAALVFADVEAESGNITPKTLQDAIEATDGSVAAIVPVHLGGLPCDMPAIRRIAERLGAIVIEDACHAPLASYDDGAGGRATVGACMHSDAAVFSFHAIKHIAMGEGGGVATNDDALAGRMRRLRNHGITRDPSDWVTPPDAPAPWYYEMQTLGWNYRVGELNCALGRSQLRRLEAGIVRRDEIARRYHELLGDLNSIRLPSLPDHPRGHVWHLFAPAFDFEAIGISRGELMSGLAARGIGSQVHYIPLYRQPFYASRIPNKRDGAERYYRDTLSIPMYPSMGDGDVQSVAAAIRDLVAA